MRAIAYVFGAFLVAFAATGASANTVTLERQSNTDWFNGGGYAGVSGITNRSGNFLAGGIRVNDGTDDLTVWCLDVFDNLHLPSDYGITTTPYDLTSGALNATRVANIEKLFEVNYSTLVLNHSTAGDAQSAGFQLALWELLYETVSGPFDVATGVWHASSSAAAIIAANTFLGNLGNAITQAYSFTFYESLEGGQHLVSVTPIPLPAAGLLLGFGLLGLFGLSRRKSQKTGGVGLDGQVGG